VASGPALVGVGLLGPAPRDHGAAVLGAGPQSRGLRADGHATAVAFVLSLLAHEVGRALVALGRGLQVRRITLWLLGGVSEIRGNAPEPGVEMRIAVAGPLVSLGLGGICTGLAVMGGGRAGPRSSPRRWAGWAR
jgi:Zn-dependent protease